MRCFERAGDMHKIEGMEGVNSKVVRMALSWSRLKL